MYPPFRGDKGGSIIHLRQVDCPHAQSTLADDQYPEVLRLFMNDLMDKE